MKYNDNWNKVKTREELLELLKGYRGILTQNMQDYLNSLIELEFSVMREYISDSDRKALAELEVYKKIAIYNIYNRTLNFFNQQKGEFIIFGNNDGCEGLKVSTKLSAGSVKLFDFDYKELRYWNYHEVPSDFKTLKIGDISLFKILESKELREAELDIVMKTLEGLYNEQNPNPPLFGIIGGAGPVWAVDHARKIQEYEERIKQLDSKKELSDEDKRTLEKTQQIHDLLLEDFGLTSESFVDKVSNSDNEKMVLEKTFVKRMPNLSITDHIKYI